MGMTAVLTILKKKTKNVWLNFYGEEVENLSVYLSKNGCFYTLEPATDAYLYMVN